VAVTVEAASRDALKTTITVAGVIAAAPGADWLITAPEVARILELTKVEGDRVTEGDVLVRFEVPSLITEIATRRSEVTQAGARLQNAKTASTRLAGLLDRGIASQKEVDEARRELTEAEAAVAQAQSSQQAVALLESRLVVRARFNGIVVKRMHNQGDMVEASMSDPVMRIVDPSRIEALASVPVSELNRISIGRSARVLTPTAPNPLEGAVVSRPPVVDVAIAAGDVRVSLPKGTTTATLAVGTPVQIEIVTDERKNVLVVPSGAIARDGNEVYVMIAGADHKAHKKAVKIGITTRARTEILEGVEVGDKVILLGAEPVPDGATIEIER
jgi:RND family efflux transporter MFP subunit